MYIPLAKSYFLSMLCYATSRVLSELHASVCFFVVGTLFYSIKPAANTVF